MDCTVRVGEFGVSATAALRVIDALVAGFDEATEPLGVLAPRIHDGPVVNDGGSNISLVVGVSNPADRDEAASVDAVQEWAHANTLRRDESGSVACVLSITSQAGSLSACREDAGVILDALTAWLRMHTDLGLSDVFWAAAITRVDVYQQQDDAGAYCDVRFSVAYKARLT